MTMGIDPRKPWFSLMEDDRQEGPFTLAALHDHIRKGRIQADTLIWQQGMKDWQAAGDMPSFSALFATPEPAGRVATAAPSGPPVLSPSPAVLTETLATTQPEARRSNGLGPLPQSLAPSRAEASNPSDLASFLFSDLSGPREPSGASATSASKAGAAAVARSTSAVREADEVTPAAPKPKAAPAPQLPREESTVIVATRPDAELTKVGFLPRFSWNPQYTPVLGALIALSLIACFAIALWNFR